MLLRKGWKKTDELSRKLLRKVSEYNMAPVHNLVIVPGLRLMQNTKG